jgi:hypothetical protein
VSNGNGILAQLGCYIDIQGLTVEATGANQGLLTTLGYGVNCSGAWMNIWNCVLGSCGEVQLAASNGGTITFNALTMTFTGNTQYAMYCSQAGQIWMVASTINVTGLTCSAAFVAADEAGSINAAGNTFIGSVTGPKFAAGFGGTINSGSGGINYFPGSIAGNQGSGYYG